MKQVKTIRIDMALATAATLLMVTAGGAMAQEKANNGVNPLSVRPINDGDIMMKKTLWRRIDLREKQNQSMFSKNNEISRYLIDAVKAGLLDAYPSDSVNTKMTIDKFNQKLLVPNTAAGLSAEEIAAGFKDENKPGGATNDGWDTPKKPDAATKKTADDGWGTPAPKKTAVVDDGWGATPPKKKASVASKKGKKGSKLTVPVVAPKDTVAVAKVADPTGEQFYASQLNLLELKEDWIFDKKRSRLYYDIQTVGLVLPSDVNPTGLEVPVAYFKYKDLDKLFRSDPKKFIWYNPQNQAQHRNLADAFDLRLFYGRITKVSNPADKDLISQYGSPREGLLKSYQLENELMETEHSLWEY